MGGQAFASRVPPLLTPRMPPEVYDYDLTRTLQALREPYSQVESPIEAPGKTTHGDIDVLVTGALEKDFDPVRTPWNDVADKIAEVLGAVASLRHNGMPIVNLAVRWPRMLSQNVPPAVGHSPEAEQPEAGDINVEDKYVQIDIHHLHSPERFQWEVSQLLS